MKYFYRIEPAAPLVFRSGRPFGTGSRESARFPWPSAIAGALRSAWMRSQGDVSFQQTEHALQHRAGGPFLLGPDGEIFVPKPADAVVVLDEKTQTPVVHRLLPGNYPPGCGSDLPKGLQPVVAEREFVGKPQRGASFWPISAILDWDSGRAPIPDRWLYTDAEPAPLRLRQSSTHVRIDRRRQAAEDGQLFQMEALDFGRERLAEKGFAEASWQLGAFYQEALADGLLPLGGERRGAWIQRDDDGPHTPPTGVLEALERSDTFALTLCTPALLSGGWRPAWLDPQMQAVFPDIPGLRVQLLALANERWQGISGWDLAHKRPKPGRRAVPAGSTYWFRILERPENPNWAQQLWFYPLSDNEQDRRDGWGLAFPRTVPTPQSRHV
ncbi:type III-B CRISPR module-associated Cmr3 family protein [Acidithiobacillus caldus]